MMQLTPNVRAYLGLDDPEVSEPQPSYLAPPPAPEYDSRQYDEGPREATPNSIGATPVQAYGPPEPEPPTVTIAPSGTPPSANGNWEPVQTIPNPQRPPAADPATFLAEDSVSTPPPPVARSPYDEDQPWRPTLTLGQPPQGPSTPPAAPNDRLDRRYDPRDADQGARETPRYKPPETWYGRAGEAVLQAIAPALEAYDAANEWLINNPVTGTFNPQAMGRELAGSDQISSEVREDQQRLEALIRRFRGGDTSVEPEIQALTASLNRRTGGGRAGLLAAGERNPDKGAETAGQVAQAALTFGIAPSAGAGVVRNVVGAAMDPLGQGVGLIGDAVGPAIGAARGAGRAVGAALDANAERVAAADARIAASGRSAIAPSTFGVITGNDPAQAMRGRVVPPDIADTLDFPVRVPTDPSHIRAIEAAGGSIDPERGVTMNVIRNQGPEAHGNAAARGSVFYVAGEPGAPNPYASSVNDPNRVGGTERIEGMTRFRSPLIISDAPGSSTGFGEAMRQFGVGVDQEAVARAQAEVARIQEVLQRTSPGNAAHDMASDALRDAERILDIVKNRALTDSQLNTRIRIARQAGPAGSPARAEALKDVVRRFGGTPEEIDDLLRIRGDEQDESMWAIRENILAAHARRNGYDGVVTVQPNMGTKEYGDAVEAAVQAHPQWQAQKEVVSAIRQQVDSARAALDEAKRVHGPQSEQWDDAYLEWGRLADEAQSAQVKLERIHDRLIDEVEVPIPSRITELADVREARNPTPGRLSPESRKAEIAYRAAKNQYEGAVRNGQNSPDDLAALKADMDQKQAVFEQTERVYAETPGYTLREDIPRRQRSFAELERTYKDLQQRAATSATAAEGEALMRQMKALEPELMDALKRERGQSTSAMGTPGIAARAGSQALTDVSNSVGGGVFGAAAGGAMPADSEEQRRQNMLTGAGIGMVAGPAAGRLMSRAGGALATPGISPNRMGPAKPRQDRAAEVAGRIALTTKEEVARLRLDKFPDAIRDDLLEAAQQTDFGARLRRGVLSDEAVQTLASEYAPSVEQAIAGGRRGRAYSAEEIIGLRNLLVNQTLTVRELGEQIAARTLPVDEHTAALARLTLEQQRLTQLAEVAYGGAPAEAGRALRQFRQLAQDLENDPSGAGLRYLRQQFGTLDKAEEVAAQYQTLVAAGASPVELAKFLRSAKGGWLNRLSILRYGSMLSSTTTHLINGTGNLLMQGVDVATTPLAVGIDVARATATGAPRQVFMAELPARLHGMAAGAKTGLTDAAFIMRHGLRPEDVTKLDQLHQGFGTNIPGIAPVGSKAAATADFLMEGPLRALSAADAVFRSTARGGHLAAEATAAAMQANGGKKATAEAIERFMNDPKIIEIADAKAARAVLQEQRQEITAINGMIRNLPPAGQTVVSGFIPFIRTPYNLVAQGVGMTPAGIVPLIRDIRAGKSPREVEERLGRMAIGTAIMGVAAWDYLNGRLTGPRPESEAERSTLPPGWREWSRKVTLPSGEVQYIPLASLGPMAIPSVISVLIAEGTKQGKSMDPERAAQIGLGMGQFASDQTFLRGVSDLAGIFDRGGSKIENAVENLATQLSPHVLGGGAIGRQIQQIVGMPQRDPEGAIEALLATHPLTAGQVPVRRDVLGRPVQTAPGGLQTAIAPFRASVERDAPVIRAFRTAGEGLPMKPPEKARDPYTGETRTLNRSQQTRWRVEFGQALRDGWDGAGQPNDSKTLRKIESDARDAALSAVLGG